MEIPESLLERAIGKWGVNAQWGMVEEECMELAIELHKSDKRSLDNERWTKIIDEVADVNIMIAQANLMLGKEVVQERINFKLTRLKERLEKSVF